MTRDTSILLFRSYSRLLFTWFLGDLHEYVEVVYRYYSGVWMTVGVWVYADDVVLLASYPAQLQGMTNKLNKY